MLGSEIPGDQSPAHPRLYSAGTRMLGLEASGVYELLVDLCHLRAVSIGCSHSESNGDRGPLRCLLLGDALTLSAAQAARASVCIAKACNMVRSTARYRCRTRCSTNWDRTGRQDWLRLLHPLQTWGRVQLAQSRSDRYRSRKLIRNTQAETAEEAIVTPKPWTQI